MSITRKGISHRVNRIRGPQKAYTIGAAVSALPPLNLGSWRERTPSLHQMLWKMVDHTQTLVARVGFILSYRKSGAARKH